MAIVGFLLIFLGLFSGIGRCAVPGAPCPSPRLGEIAAYLGVVLLVLGVAWLMRTGWRGGASAWMLAAVAVVPATWTIYEIARQSGCPLIADPAQARACLAAFGEMTAPVLSFGAGGAVLAMGWARLRRTGAASDIRRR